VIPVEDYILVAALVGVSVLITFVLSSIYYAQRVWEIQRDHVEDMQAANQELINARLVNADNKMQARVLGAMPVSRLLKGDNDE